MKHSFSKIVFADESIKKAFFKLKTGTSEEKQIYSFLVRAFEDIENDAYCGTKISKSLMPKEYLRKYAIDNLWKYDLPNGWRLIYSISRNELVVISIVIEWFDHQGYEKRFNY